MDEMEVLKLSNVRKEYDGHVAVHDISFEVRQGVIFGLLGPNGAGKTTLIRMITGITEPDRGEILLQGEPINGVLHPNIGYLPEERGLYRKMKVADQLVYLTRLKGIESMEAKRRVRYWLERFEMMDWRKRKIEELSKGMQQKIQFIATVIHKPNLLILDEPFTGLDPVNTNLIKAEIRRLRDEGCSIIFSTHRMEQVEEICEEITLVNKGRNILSGAVDRVKHNHKQNRYKIKIDQKNADWNTDMVSNVELVSDTFLITLVDGCSSNDLLKFLLDRNMEIQHFEEELPSLNEVFIKTVTS